MLSLVIWGGNKYAPFVRVVLCRMTKVIQIREMASLMCCQG